jgi:hypothetical protein
MLKLRMDTVLDRFIEYRAVHWLVYAGTKSLGLRARSLNDLAVLTGVFELIVWVWRPANWQLAMVLGREVGRACVTITDVVCRRS